MDTLKPILFPHHCVGITSINSINEQFKHQILSRKALLFFPPLRFAKNAVFASSLKEKYQCSQLCNYPTWTGMFSSFTIFSIFAFKSATLSCFF